MRQHPLDILAPAPAVDRVLYLVDRLLNLATRGGCRLLKYYIVSQPVGATRLLPGRRGDSIQIREVQAGSPLLAGFDRPAAVIADRFAQGARCLLASKADRVAGFIWFLIGTGYEEDEVHCRFEPLPAARRAWDFDVYIHPEFRGGLVFLKLWSAASEHMHAAGVEFSLSRISAYKSESLHAHGRLGARALARCIFLKLWAWQLMWSSVAPRFASTTGRSTRPVLRLES